MSLLKVQPDRKYAVVVFRLGYVMFAAAGHVAVVAVVVVDAFVVVVAVAVGVVVMTASSLAKVQIVIAAAQESEAPVPAPEIAPTTAAAEVTIAASIAATDKW